VKPVLAIDSDRSAIRLLKENVCFVGLAPVTVIVLRGLLQGFMSLVGGGFL
jgi:hypothetical protein